MSGMRCFLCGARAFAPTARTLAEANGKKRAFAFACGSCGVLVGDTADMAECGTDLRRRLSVGKFQANGVTDYGLDAFTLRIAATLRGLAVRPLGKAQLDALRNPHSPLSAEAELFALADASPAAVTLGICCRPGELDGVLKTLRAHSGWADDVVILVDDVAHDAMPIDVAGCAEGRVRVAARPLSGDFAAQRNALAALASSAWRFQLDADEVLEPGTGRLLGALAADAERHGVVSIGLRRRNLVDGVLSDLFPDTQYRLNHSSVSYAGIVHERPAVDWPRSTIALHGCILHRMARAHVETRSRRYEQMQAGHGRLEEQALLLTSYRP